MSVYYPSFNYLGINSQRDMGLVVAHFDGDSGEVETFLSMDPVYTDNYLGTRRIDYGAKYNSVAVFNITLIKQGKADTVKLTTSDDCFLTDANSMPLTVQNTSLAEPSADFSVAEIRECLKWLTGVQSNSSLDLIVDGEVKYTFTGRFTNASHYKMDARTVGLVLEFTSIAPWAYSAVQTEERKIINSDTFYINCDTDDLYSNVAMKTTYSNGSGESVIIKNLTTGEETKINKLAANEVVTLDNNMMITSDNTARVFGNDFNFIFPQLRPGVNMFEVIGDGNIKFEYTTPVKLGNVAIDINTYTDPICDDSGTIAIDMLPWSRISDIPTTLREHNIQDAYTKVQVDEKLANLTINNVYTKTEIDTMFKDFVDDDVYTKDEVDALLSSAEIKIDEDELNAMLVKVLV